MSTNTLGLIGLLVCITSLAIINVLKLITIYQDPFKWPITKNELKIRIAAVVVYPVIGIISFLIIRSLS